MSSACEDPCFKAALDVFGARVLQEDGATGVYKNIEGKDLLLSAMVRHRKKGLNTEADKKLSVQERSSFFVVVDDADDTNSIRICTRKTQELAVEEACGVRDSAAPASASASGHCSSVWTPVAISDITNRKAAYHVMAWCSIILDLKITSFPANNPVRRVMKTIVSATALLGAPAAVAVAVAGAVAGAGAGAGPSSNAVSVAGVGASAKDVAVDGAPSNVNAVAVADIGAPSNVNAVAVAGVGAPSKANAVTFVGAPSKANAVAVVGSSAKDVAVVGAPSNAKAVAVVGSSSNASDSASASDSSSVSDSDSSSLSESGSGSDNVSESPAVAVAVPVVPVPVSAPAPAPALGPDYVKLFASMVAASNPPLCKGAQTLAMKTRNDAEKAHVAETARVLSGNDPGELKRCILGLWEDLTAKKRSCDEKAARIKEMHEIGRLTAESAGIKVSEDKALRWLHRQEDSKHAAVLLARRKSPAVAVAASVSKPKSKSKLPAGAIAGTGASKKRKVT